MKELFKLRGTLSKSKSLIIGFVGFVILLSLWELIYQLEIINPQTLPSPISVVTSIKELHFEDYIVRNSIYSISLNYAGYLIAVVLALPLGYLIGLFPLFDALFSKYIDAMRYLPLAACTGLFIGFFGISDLMKILFLAAGILVYLLPVITVRIKEVEKVLDQTAITMGASKWQRIKTVFIPAAMSEIFTDIRVLVAISWTYITIAELLNKTGGIGAMSYEMYRQGRPDKVIAVLLVIVLIGLVQDLIFKFLEKKIFPHKYANA
jgi:NitT/TauT family transport system permease protein